MPDAQAFQRLLRYGERFALLCIDLDGFKRVNDRFGHQAGDELLQQAADRLVDLVDDRHFVARIGGDEFAVVARGMSEAPIAQALAADVATRFDAIFALEAGAAFCHASVGFALAPVQGLDPKTLFAYADNALYRAKHEPRETATSRPTRSQHGGRRRRELTRDMKPGLARGEFFLQYQPILSFATDRIESFEALARWRHPALGLIAPLEFIDIAEKNGFIHDLGEWILFEACREAASWAGAARISINVSGEQLCDASFVSIFDRALAASGMSANQVQIEVTESASLAVVDEATRALESLHARGAEIVLDDFGVGYSSFDLIRRLPVGRLKIDRAFVTDLPLRRDNAAIVEAITGLARALDLQVTAEGVETAEQMAYLRLAGCSHAQGYLIARPLDVADARARIGIAPEPGAGRAAA